MGACAIICSADIDGRGNVGVVCIVFSLVVVVTGMASAIQTAVLQSASHTEDVSPGEIILKKLFAQFVVSSETKLKFIATQRQVYDCRRE